MASSPQAHPYMWGPQVFSNLFFIEITKSCITANGWSDALLYFVHVGSMTHFSVVNVNGSQHGWDPEVFQIGRSFLSAVLEKGQNGWPMSSNLGDLWDIVLLLWALWPIVSVWISKQSDLHVWDKNY
eukprot:TRINITY_DN8627_c1_g1_i1.p1 TRINITY_DN8627_c1_g1~~TRINITY_DN8627_c1_g1_i1.p1  ORF type:complete len:139 (-),score=17.64 TRINITY_DN8627_c1_g1_i1:1414-1794(-)